MITLTDLETLGPSSSIKGHGEVGKMHPLIIKNEMLKVEKK